MALIDDINALPTTLADGNTGHLANHETVHAGLKHLASTNPDGLAITSDSTVGSRIWIGGILVHADTGERDITSLLDPLPNYGSLKIRRAQGHIILYSTLNYVSGVEVSLKVPAEWWTGRSLGAQLLHQSGSLVAQISGNYSGALTFSWKTNQATSSYISIPVFPGHEWPTELIGA